MSMDDTWLVVVGKVLLIGFVLLVGLTVLALGCYLLVR